MKKTIALTLASLIAAGVLHARTWTSAEGGKTFKGDYVSHTDEFVTVKKGFKTVRFKISLLSEDDKKWLKEKKAGDDKKETSTKELDFGKLGKKINSKLVKLDSDKYVDFKQEKAPDYYLLYFTASW